MKRSCAICRCSELKPCVMSFKLRSRAGAIKVVKVPCWWSEPLPELCAACVLGAATPAIIRAVWGEPAEAACRQEFFRLERGDEPVVPMAPALGGPGVGGGDC